MRSLGVRGEGALESLPQISLPVPAGSSSGGCLSVLRFKDWVLEEWGDDSVVIFSGEDIPLWEITTPKVGGVRVQTSVRGPLGQACGRQKGPMFLDSELHANEALIGRLSK